MRCGLSPSFAQMRATIMCEILRASPTFRVLQCAAPSVGAFYVQARTLASILAAPSAGSLPR